MDYFSLCLNGICLLGQGVLHMAFISRLAGKRQELRYFVSYFFLLCIMDRIFRRIPFAIGAQLLVLYGINRFAMGSQPCLSCVSAILAIYVSQFSFGIVNSLEAVVFPGLMGKPLLYILILAATLAAFVVCACCYGMVLKFLSLAEGCHMPYIGLLLFPGLFIFISELYILHTSYGSLPAVLSLEEKGMHAMLMSFQVLGLGALLCTLYAYQRICQGFQAQAALDSLAQAAGAQKAYITEAQIRYEKTKAFRHDIKNHLSVLEGLLNGGRWEDGKNYLKKLEKASASLSVPCQTGNPVVDILLGEKLGLAKSEGITTEVSLCLPQPCGMDDFDLCVVFANALDNAIHACRADAGRSGRFIRIIGERQGDFYRLAFENTCLDGVLPPMGTGLSNIRAISEKYQGSMLAEQAGGFFSLNILLDISLQTEDSSRQGY
ncbi:MAG: GHKL domain-containing protein [Lachnospiraceae bacterium]|nr:GHKL domain-containing protein [Lachnospiraceae bacterium]